MHSITLTFPRPLTLLTDVIVVVALYTSISYAHVFPFPLYMLDPMKLLVLVVVIFTGRRNTFFLAATLPLFSFLMTGHPIFPKFLVMSIELIVFSAILFSEKLGIYGENARFFFAILLSKMIYYATKAILIGAGLLSSSLFTTPIKIQLFAILILFMGFWLMKLQKMKMSNI